MNVRRLTVHSGAFRCVQVYLGLSSLSLQGKLFQLLQDVVLTTEREKGQSAAVEGRRRLADGGLLKVFSLGCFLLLLPLLLFGGPGSLNLCSQSVDVHAVIFGTGNTHIPLEPHTHTP